MSIISIAVNTDASYIVTLKDSTCSTVGTFTGADVLTGVVWSGDDTAVLIEPTVEWIEPTEGTIRLSFAAGQTATLTPGRYRSRIVINTTDGRAISGWEGFFDLLPSPGSAVLPTTYCSFNDLLMYAPWLKGEQTENDLAGFAEQRHLAREFIDRVILRAYYPTGPGEAFLQTYLDDDKLLVTSAVREVAAKMSIAYICGNILNSTNLDSSYQFLAYRFQGEAHALLMNVTAAIDTDGDGLGDLYVPLGRTSIRNHCYSDCVRRWY